MLQNSALRRICTETLQVEQPQFINMNRLSAVALAHLSAQLRFDGALFPSLDEFQVALVLGFAGFPRCSRFIFCFCFCYFADSLSSRQVHMRWVQSHLVLGTHLYPFFHH